MSSGPGILQQKILNLLGNSPSLFYNQLLWEIAFEREEIQGKSKLSPYIETGIIKKSFKENLRRSIESLENNLRISVEKRKLTDIDEAFRYFPYHTDRLEIHQLRKLMLPVLKEYITEENPQKFGNSKIEEAIILQIKKDPNFSLIKADWNKIEREIINILNHESQINDLWLRLLVRGRYLFSSTSIKHSTSFVGLYNSLKKQNTTSEENETLAHINDMVANTFDAHLWNLGKTKSIYYDMANMNQYVKDHLKDDVKKYLLCKKRDIVASLPGHKELPRGWAAKRGITYSQYIDQILTRQILRNQKIISLV